MFKNNTINYEGGALSLKNKSKKMILTLAFLLIGTFMVMGIINLTLQAASVTNFTVDYAIQNDWGSGATISVTIKNTGTSAINGWTLGWTFNGNQKIVNMWNASYTQNGTSITAKNMEYNSSIPANGTVSFGFGISYTGTNAKPTNFTLNDNSSSTTTTSVVTSTAPRTTTAAVTTNVPTTTSSSSEAWENNVGTINLGNSTTATGSGVSVSGSTVNITAGGDFTVTGTLSNGMIKINTTDKCKLRLSGCSITNSSGPAIFVENADKAFITLTENTTNTLSDGSSYSNQNAKATLFSNDDLELKGNGSLNVTANYDTAIRSDDDLIIENGNITVRSAVNDSLHANNGVKIKGGNLNLTATKDCIQSGEKEILVEGGTLNISAGSQAFVSDTAVTINDGIINVTKCEEGIEAKLITFNGGTTTINANDDALNATMGTYTVNNDNSQLLINNGTLYLSSVIGDTLDSNGIITIKGGTVAAHGPQSQPEVGADSNGTFTVTGGLVIVSGTNSFMTQYPTGSSSQYSIAAMLTSAQPANSIICVKDASGKELVKFKPKRSYYSVVFSSPELRQGSTYTIYTGGSVSGGTDTNGLITGGTYSGGTSQATITVNTSPTTTSGNFSGGGGFPWGM